MSAEIQSEFFSVMNQAAVVGGRSEPRAIGELFNGAAFPASVPPHPGRNQR